MSPGLTKGCPAVLVLEGEPPRLQDGPWASSPRSATAETSDGERRCPGADFRTQPVTGDQMHRHHGQGHGRLCAKAASPAPLYRPQQGAPARYVLSSHAHLSRSTRLWFSDHHVSQGQEKHSPSPECLLFTRARGRYWQLGHFSCADWGMALRRQRSQNRGLRQTNAKKLWPPVPSSTDA